MQKSLAAAECEETRESNLPLLTKVTAVFQENSIPAVRKFARSAKVTHRLFWAVVFLGTFTGFVVHLVSITIRFNEIPVSTEATVEKVDRMPSILVCPQNYFNDVRMRRMKNYRNSQLSNMTFDEIYNDILPMFWNLIYKMRQRNSPSGTSVDRKMVGLKIKNNFLWYLSNLWKDDGRIQHEKQDVFLHSFVKDTQFNLANFSDSFDTSRDRCFAWESSNSKTESATMILNVPDGRYFYAEQDAMELVSDTGLWLHICFNDAFGCHDSIKYFLHAGQYVKIDLRKSVVQQLPVDNVRQCVDSDAAFDIKADIFADDDETLRLPYTSPLCTDVFVQRSIFEQCDCLSVLLPTEAALFKKAVAKFGRTRRIFCSVPPDFVLEHHGFPADCFHSRQNASDCVLRMRTGESKTLAHILGRASDFLKRDRCHDVLFEHRHRSTDACPKLCRRQQFSSVHSVVPWPESQLSRSYSKTFARIFVNTISPYVRKWLLDVQNSSLDPSVVETVNRTFNERVFVDFNKSTSYNKGMEYLVQRLLLLQIGYASGDMQTMSEQQAYPLKSFLSDIGGLMGLWIGMAIVSICELLLITLRVVIFLLAKCVACTGR